MIGLGLVGLGFLVGSFGFYMFIFINLGLGWEFLFVMRGFLTF